MSTIERLNDPAKTSHSKFASVIRRDIHVEKGVIDSPPLPQLNTHSTVNRRTFQNGPKWLYGHFPRPRRLWQGVSYPQFPVLVNH